MEAEASPGRVPPPLYGHSPNSAFRVEPEGHGRPVVGDNRRPIGVFSPLCPRTNEGGRQENALHGTSIPRRPCDVGAARHHHCKEAKELPRHGSSAIDELIRPRDNDETRPSHCPPNKSPARPNNLSGGKGHPFLQLDLARHFETDSGGEQSPFRNSVAKIALGSRRHAMTVIGVELKWRALRCGLPEFCNG
jgi:hypothetical protein